MRVAHTLAEAAALQPGEILVTPITDIGWTPYFSLIGGSRNRSGQLGVPWRGYRPGIRLALCGEYSGGHGISPNGRPYPAGWRQGSG